MVKNLPAMQGTCIRSLGQEDRSLGKGNGNPLQFLPGESHGQRSLVGYSPWGHKELDMTEQLTHTHRDVQSSDLYINKGPSPIPLSLHCVGPYHLRKNEKSVRNPELANLKF